MAKWRCRNDSEFDSEIKVGDTVDLRSFGETKIRRMFPVGETILATFGDNKVGTVVGFNTDKKSALCLLNDVCFWLPISKLMRTE